MRWSRAARAIGLAAVSLGAMYACAGSDDAESTPQACAPGQQIFCGCPGGTQGTQVCLASGTGYSACECAGGGAGPGGNGTTSTTGSTGASGGAGLTGGGDLGGAGGDGTGGNGTGGNGTGGSIDSCNAAAFPVGLADLAPCVGQANNTPCGTGTGTCLNERCFLNCSGNSCASPYECVTFYGANVCAALVSCGTRCNSAKAVLCTSPAVCITTDGDAFGQCLLECVANDCPFDAGSQALDCVVEAGGDWFCGFVCDSAQCPAEYDCAVSGTPRQCEPQQ